MNRVLTLSQPLAPVEEVVRVEDSMDVDERPEPTPTSGEGRDASPTPSDVGETPLSPSRKSMQLISNVSCEDSYAHSEPICKTEVSNTSHRKRRLILDPEVPTHVVYSTEGAQPLTSSRMGTDSPSKTASPASKSKKRRASLFG